MSPADASLAPELDRSFDEPWQAQAFAMVVQLHHHGVFTWAEWADELAAAIRAAQAAGDPDDGTTFYRHWLTALESLVAKRSLATREELRARHEAWEAAAASTPHGEPIVLSRPRTD